MPEALPIEAYVKKLQDLVGKIASGDHSVAADELYELTVPGRCPEGLTALAESIGMMLVQIEARQYETERYSRHLEEMVAERTAKLQAANERLAFLAHHDVLTGLFNRGVFYGRLQEEWRRLGRERKPLALIMADVDCFKLYNDTYGHQAGDECLRAMARVFTANASGPLDLAARYGGEEFIILLPEADQSRALEAAESIRAQFAALKIPHRKNTVGPYATVSLGVSSAVPAEDWSVQKLIEAADQALYVVKGERGKNGVFYRAPASA
ncbi:MAG: GGDEF domain-containing protein [Elusimicrobia bacterium]|jgi:diguanylate cyclase (GGDEF)-like protein|nr:GGDEF domain-containing protein [Elusimicrobiota bacterium]